VFAGSSVRQSEALEASSSSCIDFGLSGVAGAAAMELAAANSRQANNMDIRIDRLPVAVARV
jgi:hypothetical protein